MRLRAYNQLEYRISHVIYQITASLTFAIEYRQLPTSTSTSAWNSTSIDRQLRLHRHFNSNFDSAFGLPSPWFRVTPKPPSSLSLENEDVSKKERKQPESSTGPIGYCICNFIWSHLHSIYHHRFSSFSPFPPLFISPSPPSLPPIVPPRLFFSNIPLPIDRLDILYNSTRIRPVCVPVLATPHAFSPSPPPPARRSSACAFRL
ncbi:hypothetical protein AWENTII_001483 [Aspergillus wentii]